MGRAKKKKKPTAITASLPSKFSRVLASTSTSGSRSNSQQSCHVTTQQLVTVESGCGKESVSNLKDSPLEPLGSVLEGSLQISSTVELISQESNLVLPQSTIRESAESTETESLASPGKEVADKEPPVPLSPTKPDPSVKTMASRICESAQLQELREPSQHVSGAPFILIPDDNLETAKEEFKEFVYARFHGDAPEMGKVIGVVNAIWARSGPRIFVHRIGQNTYMLKTPNIRTKEILLSRNVWKIAGYPLFVAPWSPDFSPEQPQLTEAVVPVELRGVPYLLFNQQSLSRIATAVGKPVSMAPETERKENFEVARLWVKVNLLAELPTRIVSGFSNGREVEISVSYPWLPSKCQTCGKFGHGNSMCSQRYARGDMNSQDKGRKDPRPVRARSGGSKGRSSFRAGRSLYTKRHENLTYRVKEPKKSSPASDDRDQRSTEETILHDTSSVHVSEKEGDIEECLTVTGKSSYEEPLRKSADVDSDSGKKREGATVECTPVQKRQTPLSTQSISLDKQMGQTSVVVFHEEIIGSSTAPLLDQSEESGSPFFLVNNKKSSRKATKA
ncbi:hypothetical protein F2Q69_00063063 [Brassica cretica]|uniref:DUF4283 domain-containing protein n=1 Tax=Brassica cretica TaxID=69181 RepID=A0A8S9RTB8_BRACR|nr:hypothetical protein F2Q69_00063063 [Brassica cretica]